MGAIKRSIGWWSKPTYGDDGLLSISNASALKGTSYEVRRMQWGGLGWIACEIAAYVVLWALIVRPWFNR